MSSTTRTLHVKDGGGTFRARFGVEREGETLLAEDSFSAGSELTDGYPEFTMGVFKKLGWDKDLTRTSWRSSRGSAATRSMP